jgi:hypothetical protein
MNQVCEQIDLDLKNKIKYGDLTRYYNADIAMTSVESSRLILEKEIELEQSNEQERQEMLEILLFLKSHSNTSLSKRNLDIRELNLMRRSSLIDLIERNRELQIYCPFDEMALVCLKRNSLKNPNVCEYKFNSLLEDILIKKLSTIDYIKFNLNQSYFPNSTSSYLVPFFFDIFKATELKQFSSKTLDILLNLKNSYQPHAKIFNYDFNYISKHMINDILWNCFALFNYKFNEAYKKSFLNFYMSIFYIIKFFDIQEKSEVKMSRDYQESKEKLRQASLCFLEALVLNGLYDLKDYKLFKEFVVNTQNNFKQFSFKCSGYDQNQTQQGRPNIISTYREKIKSEEHHTEALTKAFFTQKEFLKDGFPLKLKHKCRIEIKKNMNNFDCKTLDSLNISESIKTFLLFEKEFVSYFKKLNGSSN